MKRGGKGEDIHGSGSNNIIGKREKDKNERLREEHQYEWKGGKDKEMYSNVKTG